MAKGSNSLSGRRSSSHNTKPYDANNSFVKKMATKVTDLIPQRSWISKWFNSSQGEEDILEDNENPEEVEAEEDIQKPPPLKRPCIRMDVTHPPGTFSIQPRSKSAINKTSSCKQQYSVHNEMSGEFPEPITAGPSGVGHLVSSTPAIPTDIRSIAPQRSDLNSLVAATNNGTANGMDDNSESSESTSGCSSLIPQTNRQEALLNVSYNSSFSGRKRFLDDKLSFTNHLQTPRSLFLDNNSRDSLSSRRPSFNASVMTNTLDRASPLSSPFYNGNITFGGANAAGLYKRGRNLFNNANEIQLKVPKRTSVEVKPSTSAGVDSSGMSQTAKKILEALEHFSSPITDAKKIPIKTTNNTAQSMSKKRPREERASPTSRIGLRHLTRELTVPTVPDILKLRRRQKLQDTTVAARKIVSARSELPPPQEYHLRTQADDDSKQPGKLKAKAKTNLDEEETVEAINLPNIPLPISSLPNFNFTTSPKSNAVDKNVVKKEEIFTFASPIKVTSIAKNLKSINNFTFSRPISANDKQSMNSSNDSSVSSKSIDTEPNSGALNSTPTVTQNFIWSNSSTAARPRGKIEGKGKIQTNSSELLFGSVTDVLCSKPRKTEPDTLNEGKPKVDSQTDSINNKNVSAVETNKSENLKASEDISTVWECSECLIKNSNSETQCFACKATKQNRKANKTFEPISTSNNVNKEKTAVNDSFGAQFKLQSTQWECKSCYVRNKQTDVKCTACNSLKPGTETATELNVKKSTDSNLTKTSSEESWQCPGCMLKNSVNLSTCPCCKTSKPNSVKMSSARAGNEEDTNASPNKKICTTTDVPSQTSTTNNNDIMDKFKQKKDTWECPCCMVYNAISVDSCTCCNTAKPNSGTTVKSVQPPLPTNGFGDKFKKPEGAWNCDSCMLQNDGKATECVACTAPKPGSKKSESSTTTSTGSTLQFSFGMPANTGGFKFGIDKEDQKADSIPPLNGFKFGDSQQKVQVNQFTFGIQKEEKKVETTKTENKDIVASKSSESGFGFQINANSSGKTDAVQDAENKATPSFSFGVPKSEGALVSNDKQSLTVPPATQITPTFTFGASKSAPIQVSSKTEEKSSLLGSSVIEISKPKVESTETSAPPSSNTLIPVNQGIPEVPKTISTFSFGTVSTTATASGSTSTTVTTTCLPSTVQSSFTFSESKPGIQATSAPTFGQIATTTSTSALPSTFTFGENKIAVTTPSSLTTTATALPSGTTGTPIFPNIPSTSLFGNNDVKATTTFGTEESKPPTFGTIVNKPPAFAIPENKVSTFGSTENKPSMFGAIEPKIPVFGNTDKPAPTFGTTAATPNLFGSTVPSVFGSNNTSSTFSAESTPNIFTVTKPSESTTTNSNLFTFGTTPAQPVAQTGTGFNFSANTVNPASSTQKQLFTFGSSSNTPQSSNLFGSTFNNPASNSSTGFTFNAPKPDATPAFGQTAVAPPIFGAQQSNPQNQPPPSFSSTPSTNTGFNFGSTAPATSSGGFNFGGMPSTSASSGGFNFNPLSSTPTFDPNTPPSFNFTGGSAPPTFNATPQSTAARKFKKAVRRMR